MLAKPKRKAQENFPRAIFVAKSGALGGIRTHDLCLRRAALYPLSYKRAVWLSVTSVQLSGIQHEADNWTLSSEGCFGAESGI